VFILHKNDNVKRWSLCYVLKQKLLPYIKEFSDYFSFKQDLASAYHAKETVDLFKRLAQDFIPPSLWPTNSLDLNPVDKKIPGYGAFFSSVFATKRGRVATTYH